MSKLFKKTGTQRKPNQVTTQTGLIPVEELGHARAVYGTAHLPAALPGARILTRTGVFSHIINVDTDGDDIAHLQPLGDARDDDEMSVDDDNGLLDDLSCLEVQKRASKKKRQWIKWNDDVIPALLRPYVDLLYKTENFRYICNVDRKPECEGCQAGRLLEVFCVFFDSGFYILVMFFFMLIFTIFRN